MSLNDGDLLPLQARWFQGWRRKVVSIGLGLEFLNGKGRAADALPLQVNTYFNAVGDFYEGYAASHAKLFAVEGHGPLNLASATSDPGNLQG